MMPHVPEEHNTLGSVAPACASRFTRGIWSARTTGSSWWSSIWMPLRNGD
jgi:hypothetical protein